MKTTKLQFMEWAIDCMAYSEEEAEHLGEDYNYNLFDMLDESYHQDIKSFFK